MTVLFIAQYGPQAASSRTRLFDYLPSLRSAGVTADVLIVVPDTWVHRLNAGGRANRLLYYAFAWLRTWVVGLSCLARAQKYDVLFIQKVLFPAPVAYLLRRCRSKVLFDFDDAIFTLERVGSGWLNRLRAWRRRGGLPAMLRSAQCAVVENAYTADYAKQFCPQVLRITGPIDTERYAPMDHASDGNIVLGWIGSPTTTPYLEMIREPLEVLARKYPGLRLHLIGASPFDIGALPVETRPWDLTTEIGHLSRFDIGLMPVPDDAFTRGKGGYKLLQYMAMGLPVVASPVGINREIVDNGKNGFWAETPGEWEKSLSRLIEDADLRREMGAVGRMKMEREFSLQQGSKRLFEVIQSMVRSSKG
jgi:glycosyltransferase involved in cell wall biosynthesis